MESSKQQATAQRVTLENQFHRDERWHRDAAFLWKLSQEHNT